MLEHLVIGESLPKTYHEALMKLCYYGEEVACADWETTTIEIPITMQVLHPLQEPMISRCFIGGQRELQQYVMEMLDGILDFEIGQGNWTYTYHDRMHRYHLNDYIYVDQVACVIDKLISNPSSRRAVVDVRNPRDIISADPACLQHIQYVIHNNKLDCYVLFRSNDACKATFMNAFALIMLQKRIADQIGIEIGTYTHRANSFHCYQRDYELLKGYTSRIKHDDDLTYFYDGDWKDDMEDYIPEILKDVEKLKR